MKPGLVRRVVPLAVAAVLVSPIPAFADAPSGEWRHVQVTGLESPALYGVSAPNRGHAWAVGSQASGSEPLVLRWRHGTWTPQSVPEGTAPELVDVDARHPADVWAVGQGGGDATAKSLHWNGRTWTAVPHPSETPMAVSIDSRGSAWSAGIGADGSKVFRYRAGEWADQGLTVPSGALLNAIAARTPEDVWVGGAPSSGGGTALWRYDGESWNHMSWPSTWPHWVLQIVPVGPDDVWFYTLPMDPLFSGPELVHWDGSAFTATKTPSPYERVGTFASDVGFLGDIASDGRGGIWLQDSQSRYYRHYDGATWTNVPRPPAAGWPYMYDLEQIGRTGSLWGAGLGAGDLLNIDRFR
ncbi:hypothetical protein [Actinomadura sp. 3N407]|uniref:hypothetical protein n=1 Tax=Actinomadura sp. 3N407 TaxID=3457423 RepID=UPI003FCCCEF6